MILRLTLFLIINFAALGLGSLFTSSGVNSEWYQSLNQAPWTPPGWVFGVVWTTVMVCFSFYMAFLWGETKNLKLVGLLFGLQWVLNVAWNPVFFQLKETSFGLILISGLTLLVGCFLFFYWSDLKWKSLLIAPYFIWLLIATSLNAYIVLNN